MSGMSGMSGRCETGNDVGVKITLAAINRRSVAVGVRKTLKV